MNAPVLTSTLALTLLLLVGLVFFIRASAKDRTTTLKLASQIPAESLLPQFQQYFDDRAYRVADVDPQQGQVTFGGFVRPSGFLAVFLTLLAACGWLCLALVLSLLFPTFGKLFLALTLLSPTAGIYYWYRAGRYEQVSVQVEPLTENSNGAQSLVRVTAHRDELIQLQRNLPLVIAPDTPTAET